MDPYTDQQQLPPPRPHHGCLWGCLATLIAAAVVVVVVFGYGARYFFGIMNDDANVQTIMAAVNSSEEATAVLGTNIKAMGRERQTYSYQTGKGGTATYVLKVVGSNGEGEVRADLDVTGSKAKITSLVLTDGEGHDHYLVGAAPPNALMQNSI